MLHGGACDRNTRAKRRKGDSCTKHGALRRDLEVLLLAEAAAWCVKEASKKGEREGWGKTIIVRKGRGGMHATSTTHHAYRGKKERKRTFCETSLATAGLAQDLRAVVAHHDGGGV